MIKIFHQIFFWDLIFCLFDNRGNKDAALKNLLFFGAAFLIVNTIIIGILVYNNSIIDWWKQSGCQPKTRKSKLDVSQKRENRNGCRWVANKSLKKAAILFGGSPRNSHINFLSLLDEGAFVSVGSVFHLKPFRIVFLKKFI